MKEIIRKDLIPEPGYPKVKNEELDEFPIPCYVQVKYDGELTYLLQKENGQWCTVNRWGRVRSDYPVTNLSRRFAEEGLVFVGELYVKGENLYSFLKERSSGDKMRLAVFDVELDKPYSERYEIVADSFPQPQEGKVHIAEGKLVNSRSELESFYRCAVDRGFEGVVARSPKSRYRQPALKKKRLRTADVVILGIVKNSEFFQHEDMVGSVLVGCVRNGDYVPVGRVASGFTEQERKALYEVLMPFETAEDDEYLYVKPALVIEVSYQETVESERYEVGFTMRSPVFRRFRADKKANEEDCGLKNQFPNL